MRSRSRRVSPRDGARVLDDLVEALGRRAARGEAVAILWDMDGTLVDTRRRMQAAVHAFGRTDVRTDDVSPSWQATARRLGLDAGRFATVWQRVFWAYESFDADQPIEATVRRARRAQELGIQTIIVTGRVEELREVTRRQLERLGLHAARLFHKSATADSTPRVKAELIARLAGEGLGLGAFVTDSGEEILAAASPAVRAKAPGLRCIFVALGGDRPDRLPRHAAVFAIGQPVARFASSAKDAGCARVAPGCAGANVTGAESVATRVTQDAVPGQTSIRAKSTTARVSGEAAAPARATAARMFDEDAAPSGLLWASGTPAGAGPIEFGFEAEYAIEDADSLLLLYEPERSTDIAPIRWRGWSAARRAQWVRSQFPVPHSEDFDLLLTRATTLPELSFLPRGLIVDSDGNVEVVSRPTPRLADLWTEIATLEHHCGPALLQVTFSVPSAAAFGGGGAAGVGAPGREVAASPSSSSAPATSLDGFLTFHQLLDSFERMAVGHAMYLANPRREVLLPFTHPWLGPVTRGKQRFCRMYLESNPRGERLDTKWTRLVKRAFSSFKYVGGSAYRPALAGPDRVAIEIRDCHRNEALLALRLVRNVACFVGGLSPYAPFAHVWAFDSDRDYARLPPPVRAMLEVAIPTQERPDIAHMYSAYDRLALQVYRHFALPLKDYGDVATALGEAPVRPAARRLRAAQRAYVRALTDLAARHASGELDLSEVRRQVQGALARFAVDSGLHERLDAWRARVAGEPAAASARRQVERLVPLAPALLPSAWTGPMSARLARLAARWPTQVRLLHEPPLAGAREPVVAGRKTRGRPARPACPDRPEGRAVVVLSTHGLSHEDLRLLARDYRDAVAADTLTIRATDRGSIEVALGRLLFAVSEPAANARPYSLLAQAVEALLSLSPLEMLVLRRHLAAHHPCEAARRRISPSGWLRNLRMGATGATLERELGLAAPEEIETAASVHDRVLLSPAYRRLGWTVRWTDRPLTALAREERREPAHRPRALPRAFPPAVVPVPVVPRWLVTAGPSTGPEPDLAWALSRAPSTLDSAFSVPFQGDASLEDRLESLVARWPAHARVVDGVRFTFGNGEQLRRVLVLSVSGLGAEAERFRQDYLAAIGHDTISFPLREAADHLRTRIGALALSMSQDGVRTDEYQVPTGRRRLESLLALTAPEMARLRAYVGHVIDDTLGVLGPITLGAGTRTTRGRLGDNRPTDGGCHNCTTWVTLAPIGDAGESLCTLAAMPARWTAHDNPGWWSMFLTGASRSPRARWVVYWTPLDLADDPCVAGRRIGWDFAPR